jgi:hypothetical protein
MKSRKEKFYMNEVQPRGFWKCAFVCIGVCGPGCFGCFGDGPIFVADTATGGGAFMSGMGAGANS